MEVLINRILLHLYADRNILKESISLLHVLTALKIKEC